MTKRLAGKAAKVARKIDRGFDIPYFAEVSGEENAPDHWGALMASGAKRKVTTRVLPSGTVVTSYDDHLDDYRGGAHRRKAAAPAPLRPPPPPLPPPPPIARGGWGRLDEFEKWD